MNETVADLLGLAGWVVGIVFVLALCRAHYHYQAYRP